MPELQRLTSHPRRRLRRITLVALALTFAAVAPAAAQDSIKDARSKRDAATNAAADAAAKIDLLKAQDAEVAAAMKKIDAAVLAQQARVEAAQREVAAAEAEAGDRQGEADRLTAELEVRRAEIHDVVVADYIGRATNDETAVLRAGSVDEALRRQALLDAVGADKRRAETRLLALAADTAQAIAAARHALDDAHDRRDDLAAELDALAARRTQQQRVRDDFQRRISEWRKQEDQLARDASALSDFIKKEQARILGVNAGAPAASSVQGFAYPVKGRPVITSGFGYRRHPVYGDVRLHEGVDFDGRTGEPILAAKDGRVIVAGPRGGYGNCVVILHGNGVTTVYGHMSAIDVAVGNTVAKGELIGRIGSTGLSTGPHLHFEVRINGDAKDPMLFLP